MFAVNAIINTLRRQAIFASALLYGLTCLVNPVGGQETEEGSADVKVVALLNTDELGTKIYSPNYLAYDRDTDEIYVVARGDQRKVIVYNSDYFPIVSLGPGRGAISTGGVYIHSDGNIYLCQARTESRSARVTRYNPAFFRENEIDFDAIPGMKNFIPRNMVIGLNGSHYIVGQGARGVLVLDSEGSFSHWLKPQDKIFDMKAVEEAKKQEEDKELEFTDMGILAQEEANVDDEPLDITEFLPTELLPGGDEKEPEEKKSGTGPVKVVDIERDSTGHLYILSEETGKVYVYSPLEEFLYSFGEKGGSSGKMSRPKSLVVDEEKKVIYIVDYMRHTVLIFDLSGKFMYEFGGLGVGPGWFQYPISLELTRQGYIVVADLFNNRVQVLDVQFEHKFPLFQTPKEGKPQVRDDLRFEQTEKPEDPVDAEREAEEILEPMPL